MDGAAHLLVVEDDANAREALVELFRFEGYIAVAAADGRTALARLRTDAPVDAVVVDLGLPDIDGVDVIRAARTLPNSPAVIVFTGHYRHKRAAEAAGCDAFILKPDVDELRARVSALVGVVPISPPRDIPAKERDARRA
jgi:two-component system, OmpR family, KDP operon response regulator KdpE